MSITNVPELFGSMVFNDTVMKERLPKDVYKKLKKTMREGTAIDADVDQQGCNPLHALVPADDRHHRRKARLVHHADR